MISGPLNQVFITQIESSGVLMDQSTAEYLGEDEYTWMGWVRSGDWVIDIVKFEKCGGSDEFWVVKEEKRFPIFHNALFLSAFPVFVPSLSW